MGCVVCGGGGGGAARLGAGSGPRVWSPPGVGKLFLVPLLGAAGAAPHVRAVTNSSGSVASRRAARILFIYRRDVYGVRGVCGDQGVAPGAGPDPGRDGSRLIALNRAQSLHIAHWLIGAHHSAQTGLRASARPPAPLRSGIRTPSRLSVSPRSGRGEV